MIYQLTLERHVPGIIYWERSPCRASETCNRVSALNYVRLEHRVPTDNTDGFLNEALRQAVSHRKGGLDDRRQNFAELRSVIVRTRTLAKRRS